MLKGTLRGNQQACFEIFIVSRHRDDNIKLKVEEYLLPSLITVLINKI